MNRFLKGYQNQNNLIGWAIFAFALVIYSMTMERTASLWDCGEFIAGAYKLEVVHAPGAPLHAILGKIFSLLSFGDVTKVAMWINFLSAVSTAFAVLFCFWTTTFFARHYLGLKGNDTSALDKLKVFGAGAVAALSCTFLDSLWFSAVEGEVYALAMFFMTIIIWGATRWYRAEGPLADRWLIFIAFMVGLSMGAHLLSMLAIPFVGMMVYARYYEFAWKSLAIAIAVSFGVLVFVLQGIFTGIVNIFAQFDYFFVMTMSLGKGSGVWFALIALFSALILFLISFHAPEKAKAYRRISASLVIVLMIGSVINGSNDGSLGARGLRFLTMSAIAFAILRADNFPAVTYKATLGIMFLIMGYSSYTMVPIRANAQVPINMNKPTDAFTMHYYLNREQFGKRPLFEGPDYTVSGYDIQSIDEDGGYYAYDAKSKSYIKTQTKTKYTYKEEAKRYFPRLGFPDKTSAYREWLNPTYDVVNNQNGEVIKSFGADELQNANNYAANNQGLRVKDNLTTGDNIKFFLKYQVGYMYMRYFMWNFAGRTNDLQGNYTNEYGRWQSGIPFVDNFGFFNGNYNWSNQDLPEHRANNKANNKFYLIPFALGIIGLVYSFRNNKTMAFAISAMFLITGLAFIIYINQPPVEPRERDYVLVGSLFAFCIWMGLAVLQLIDWLSKGSKNVKWAPPVAIFIGLLAPLLMGSQGYDDHDRSGRTTTIDFASNYLNSLEQNAIIFTYGDNDTYPLWYAQEVEGIRPDVRIINLSLLMQNTYYDNLRRTMNESAPLNVSLTMQDMHSDVLSKSIDLPASNPNSILNKLENFSYSKEGALVFPIDSVIDTAIWSDYTPFYDLVKENLSVVPNRNREKYIRDLVLTDIIAGNINERPIYFAVTVPEDNYKIFQGYLSLEGLARRITPFSFNSAIPNPDLLYDNLMNKFSFGGLKDNPDMLLDENVHKQFSTLVNIYSNAIISIKDKNQEKAKDLTNRFLQELPIEQIGVHNPILYNIIPKILKDLEMNDEADAMLTYLATYYNDEFEYLTKVVNENNEDQLAIYQQEQLKKNLADVINQTATITYKENEKPKWQLDSNSAVVIESMFKNLTMYASPENLVNLEDKDLTLSKLAIAFGDTSFISAMKSARQDKKIALEKELDYYNKILDEFSEALEKDLKEASNEEEAKEIQKQYYQLPNYIEISRASKRVKSNMDAINQFDGLTPPETVTNIPPVGVGPIGPVPQDLNPVTEIISK